MIFFRHWETKLFAAGVLLALPLAAYPLVFAGVLAGKNFSLVQAVTPGVIGTFALGIIFAFPERLFALVRQKTLSGKSVVALGALLLIASLVRCLAGDAIQKFATALFYTALPLACIALGKELKHLLPQALIGYGALALIYGIISPHGEGFLLNWNWNNSIVLLGIGALVMRLFPKDQTKRRLATVIAFGGFLLIQLFWRGDYFSRGSWLALLLATGAVTILCRLAPKKRVTAAVTGALLFAAIAFWAPHFFPEKYDCRIQLGRGTHDLIVQNAITGVGVGNFEDRIQEKVPLQYYFAPHLAPRHTHPHNEMLFFLAVFGIAGAFFLAALLGAATGNADPRCSNQLFAWSALLLFFHGAFDVLLAQVLPGTLFFAACGALIHLPAAPIKKWHLASVAITAVFTIFTCSLAGCVFLGSTSYRQAAALYRTGYSAEKSLQRALKFRPDCRTLYLAGCEKLRQGDRLDAERYFERIHRQFRLGGYFHSNYMAGIAAMQSGRYHEAAQFFACEERRYPVSIRNAGAMAELAGKLGLPEKLQQQAQEKVVLLLKMRGKAPADLMEFLVDPRLDDALPCVQK